MLRKNNSVYINIFDYKAKNLSSRNKITRIKERTENGEE